MRLWATIVGIFLFLHFTSISIFGENSIDLKIKYILKETVGNISNFRGAAVVNIFSGDLMGYYIVDKNLGSNREIMAATIANIVKNIKKSSDKLGLEPLWFGICLDNEDKLLISYVNSDIFLGALYGKSSPIGAIKYQMKKAVKRLKIIL